MTDANALGANDGKYVIFIDELDGDMCDNLTEINRLVAHAFSNGAMEATIRRIMPDLPKLKPKKEDGVVFISQE